MAASAHPIVLHMCRSTSRAGPSISVNVSGVDMAADRVYLVMVSPTKTEVSSSRDRPVVWNIHQGLPEFCQ